MVCRKSRAVLVMCLMTMALVGSTVGFPLKKLSFRLPKCKPAFLFVASCGLHVAKAPHKLWLPELKSDSPCCLYMRKESKACLCKAAKTKFKPKFSVDFAKVEGVAKKCGRKESVRCQGSKPDQHKSPPIPKY